MQALTKSYMHPHQINYFTSNRLQRNDLLKLKEAIFDILFFKMVE